MLCIFRAWNALPYLFCIWKKTYCLTNVKEELCLSRWRREAVIGWSEAPQETEDVPSATQTDSHPWNVTVTSSLIKSVRFMPLREVHTMRFFLFLLQKIYYTGVIGSVHALCFYMWLRCHRWKCHHWKECTVWTSRYTYMLVCQENISNAFEIHFP